MSSLVVETYRDDMLAGKVALVVGGTTGIGAAIGDALAQVGAVVTVTGATRPEVDAALAAPDFRPRDAIVLDVRDDAAVRGLVAELPRLDVLVNCAGVIRRGMEHDPIAFAETIEINLTGTMRCCTHSREKLKSGGGAIVNLASMYSFFGAAHAPGYGASKGGVMQLTKALAVAYAAEGIRVNAVAPGWIRTPLTAPVHGDAVRSAPILARTPMGRWGEPEDVAAAAVFLCSPAARFVTGAILPVDGGYLIA